MELPKFKYSITHQPLPNWLNQILLYTLLPVELLCVLLLSFSKTRLKGFQLSLMLMSSFTIYIAWMLSSHVTLPCACGGPIPGWGWKAHLIFNSFFTIISFMGVLLAKELGAGASWSYSPKN